MSVTEGAEPDAESSAGRVTRRGLLLGAAGMAAGAAGMGVAGCGDMDVATGGLAFAERSRLPRLRPVPTPVVTPKPTPTPLKPVQVRAVPVHTLAEYTTKAPVNGVVLTIDDGPSQRWTPLVLDLLRRYQVSATFCLIGENVLERPDLARRIVGEGHAVCNHTMTHPMGMGRMPATRIEQEITGASEVIADVTGVAPRVFRAPGGNWGTTVFSSAARHGMVPLGWSVDPQDWRMPGAGVITTRLLTAQPGQILLCHDGGGNRAGTVAALGTVIPALLRRGLRFVTL